MAKGVNKAIILGNLGADPSTKYMPSGGAVTNITVATSEQWKDKQTGQSQEKTEWHKVVFFNKLAEIAGEYLKKGSKVYIEGSIRTRKWQGQDGNDQYTTEIVAREMQMLDGVSKNGVPQDHRQPGFQAQPPAQGHAPQNQSQGAGGGFSDFEDDVPFAPLGREHF